MTAIDPGTGCEVPDVGDTTVVELGAVLDGAGVEDVVAGTEDVVVTSGVVWLELLHAATANAPATASTTVLWNALPVMK